MSSESPFQNQGQTAVVLTALGVETQAVLRHLSGVTGVSVSGTGFFEGHFEEWNIAVAEVGAGNLSAAAITVRACEHYKPRVAFFIGVAGGIKDVAIGDVVVATKVYGYESGKDESTGLKVRPSVLASAHALEQRARIMRRIEDWRARLDPQIGHKNPRLCVGPIAAGEKVVASEAAATAKLILEYYGDTLAVEMEGRGFLEGVHITWPVQGCVVRGISDLLSDKSDADLAGSQERAADAASAVAFQMLSGFTTDIPKPTVQPTIASQKRDGSIEAASLEALAHVLLEAGTPPSVAALFPSASLIAIAALDSAYASERAIVEAHPSSSAPARNIIARLPFIDRRRHLIVGPPGSGKTHALWRAATQLLNTGAAFPLYLPAGQANRWDDLASMIRHAAPSLSLEDILKDPRVCIFIDGWSEFADGQYASEKQKALQALRDTRVIANGKLLDVGNTYFEVWSLELLSSQQVEDVLYAARPGQPVPSPIVLDLLRLPLLLSMHVLSEANASGTGELLRQFHDHLARSLPEGFTAALAEAVAASSLSGERSYGRFVLHLQNRASVRDIAEPVNLLRRLGTVVERSGQALPIHDLYWSWLAGRGLLLNRVTNVAIDNLKTRESYRLALQSGAHAAESDIVFAVEDDLVLAGVFDASLHSREPTARLAAGLDCALTEASLAVRSRGGLAALESRRSAYLARALQILSELSFAHLYVEDWLKALRPQALFSQRGIVGDWMGSEGSDFILDTIANHGGPEWEPWLEQLASAGKITQVEGLAAALACTGDIPTWGGRHLDDLFSVKPWKLRAAAARRSNLALARHIAHNYERLVETVIKQDSGAWVDMNHVLVACGDDAVFESLLGRFEAMSARSQELVGFAVVDRGRPWIAAFQKVAFVTKCSGQHHRLAEIVSPEIDDATARTWIDAENYKVGWRLLIARHGEAVLPELIAELPSSFGDLHHIPPLSVMRFLQQAPASLPDVLWGRIGSPMQPKAMEDLLDALATSYPAGVLSIVAFIRRQPDSLPVHHIAQALRLYEAWRERSGDQILVPFPSGTFLPFSHWITVHTATHRWHDHYTPAMFSLFPSLARQFVLEQFRDDFTKAAKVLGALKDIRSFDAELLDYMLAAAELARLIPALFSGAFDTFPPTALHRCIESPFIDQAALLFRLAAASNPLHRSLHAALIQRVLTEPINLHHYRYVASMLRAYTVEEINVFLSNAPGVGGNDWLWLVREVEAVRGERLITETGKLRHQCV